MKYYGFFLTSLVFLIIYVFFMFFYKFPLDVFFENVHYIGHAFYHIDGYTYTNSYEALENGYQNGIRVMECDFLTTSDNKFVLNHFWQQDKILSYQDFMKSKLNDYYTPMDLEDLLQYMHSHMDLYIIIDTKDNYYDNSFSTNDFYKRLVAYIQNYDSKMLKRFIPQIYDFSDYYDIKKVYNFSNYIFSLYKISNISLKKVTYFCLLHQIHAIAIPSWFIVEDKLDKEIQFIKSKNIYLYSFTINEESLYETYRKKGINGVYTDFLA